MDTGQSSLTRTPACSLPSTALSVDTASCDFPLVCSQDIFQKKMDQILKECQGCIGIADNITVHGHTEAEHDARLRDLMRITRKYDLVFYPQKMHVKAQAIHFFGCLYAANGVHPDQGNADAVHGLPAPTNITELQEFLGLRSITSSDNPSWCLTGRPWCSTPAEWQTHSLCQQGPHQNWMLIHEHWERDASCCLRSREIPHLHLWMVIHNQIRPQATWIHLQKEPSRHSCTATMHDVMPTGIQFHNPLLPWERNGHTRHALLIQPSPRPRPSTGYRYPSCPHHTRLQRSLPTSLCEWPRNAISSWPHHHRLA